MSTYEVHLGSWRRVPEEGNRFLTYRELAPKLCDYVRKLGFTHVELMPIMEHPFYGSWGYQVAGYFAPTRRYGPPEDLMFLIDQLHQAELGVILDWVPAHFPTDAHGLGFFDGSHLFEHADPRQGFHPEWNSLVFNYGRSEVRSFLMSSAMYWLEEVSTPTGCASTAWPRCSISTTRAGRASGSRTATVDARTFEAMAFLRRLNEKVYGDEPSVQTIAEESTAWPMVSQPTTSGGLGFGFKWDMGWMHDTLDYFEKDPIYRQYNHGLITFRSLYAFSEHFVLPLSHDEVVYGKKSLLEKMPGDDWQKFANLRLLLTTLWAQPGKKLLFMGGEFGQRQEWGHDRSLDWHLLDQPLHRALSLCVGELNRLYRDEPALHVYDDEAAGFEWIDGSNAKESILVFLRKGARPSDDILIALNYTPVPRDQYRVGIPRLGTWKEIFNSDAKDFGGSGWGNLGALEATPFPLERPALLMLNLTLPPLGAVMLKSAGVRRRRHRPCWPRAASPSDLPRPPDRSGRLRDPADPAVRGAPRLHGICEFVAPCRVPVDRRIQEGRVLANPGSRRSDGHRVRPSRVVNRMGFEISRCFGCASLAAYVSSPFRGAAFSPSVRDDAHPRAVSAHSPARHREGRVRSTLRSGTNLRPRRWSMLALGGRRA